MALRGSSGGEGKPRFQFKPSRNMLIILGVFVLLIVVIVVLALVLPRGGGGGAPVAEKTAEPKAVSPQATSLPGAPTAIPPTQPAAVPPTQVVQALVTPVPTPVPVPTQARPGGVEPTVAGVGGGEQALPATASGLGTWLVIIPVGVVLLGVVAWWRWRRSRLSR